MATNIYVSRKLEKLIKFPILENQEISLASLNKWNANVFYVSRKKCLLITNSTTMYSVLIGKFSVSDFNDLSSIFIKSFYSQLNADGINIDLITINKIIGSVTLCATNNDKSVIGIQNNILSYVDNWKYEFGSIDNWNFEDINSRINSTPYKILNWYFPKEKMKMVLDAYI